MISFLLGPLAIFVVLLPGLAWQRFAVRPDGSQKDMTSRLVDAAGASFSLIALVGVGTFFLRISIPGLVIWLSAVALIVLLAIYPIRRGVSQEEEEESGPGWQAALPLLIFAGILIFRFYQARELLLPAWVDSVHHTLIVRLITEVGALPQTLSPYIPIELNYHFGFHLNAAVVSYISGFEPAQTLLFFGQFLNAAVSLGIYRLTMAIWADRRRGLIAMLLTGFVLQMPAYYLTWGRYTLLMGIFLMVQAMAVVLDGRYSGIKRAQILQIGILTTGILLTHFYAALVWALFLVTFFFWQIFQNPKYPLLKDFRKLLIAVGWGAALALPWVTRIFALSESVISVDVVSPVQPANNVVSSEYIAYLWYLLGPYRSYIVYGIGFVGLFLLGWKKPARPFTLFTLVLILFSLPWGVTLAPFRSDHGVILAFIPGAIFAADLLVTPLDAIYRNRLHLLARVLFWIAIAGLFFWGVSETRNIVNEVTVFVDQDDLRAMDWIEKETPESAVFLINMVGWQQGAFRGVDGGWWIMPLTGRLTVLPPVIYGTGHAAYTKQIYEIATRVDALQTCDEEFWAVVNDSGVDYVYLRKDKGDMQPKAFVGCDGLNPEYVFGDVYIFSVLP